MREYKNYDLSGNEARALLIARYLGAVNNSTLREDTNLDTLQASHVLQKLTKELGLLKKQGAGSATTYTLKSERDYFKAETPHLGVETPHLGFETPHLRIEARHTEMTDELSKEVENLGCCPRKEKIFRVMLGLCLLEPQTKEDLMQRLDKGEQLIRKYLKELREKGIIEYVYPELPNHPYQAYKLTEKGGM